MQQVAVGIDKSGWIDRVFRSVLAPRTMHCNDGTPKIIAAIVTDRVKFDVRPLGDRFEASYSEMLSLPDIF